ncbi:MAG: hypothetical protein IT288_12665 [Bdellovibrionales bacterium]|nr:hypothetical protein [Bdellovibrionales bacterium]
MNKWLLFVLSALVLVSSAPVSHALNGRDIISIIDLIGNNDRERPRPPRYPGPGDRPYPPRYGVTCSAQDNGWEEHWRGHDSCFSCLREHGNCTETCSQSFHVCTAEGDDGHGRRYTTDGSGETEWEARDNAQRNCQWDRLYGCRIVRCDRQEEVISRRSCR